MLGGVGICRFRWLFVVAPTDLRAFAERVSAWLAAYGKHDYIGFTWRIMGLSKYGYKYPKWGYK